MGHLSHALRDELQGRVKRGRREMGVKLTPDRGYREREREKEGG